MSSMKYDKNSLSARLDKFLTLNVEENDRAIDVNSPSQVFKCMRALYYARTEADCDGTVDARLQRIFDNGTHVHLRLQEYLKKEGTLPKTFYEASITLIPKTDKDTTKKRKIRGQYL